VINVVLGPITLILGLIASYTIVKLTLDIKLPVKLASAIFVTYLSIITLIGYLLDSIGISLSVGIFLAIFSIIALIGSLCLKKRGPSNYKIRNNPILTMEFATIFLVGFLIFMLPSFPSFFPVCAHGADSAAHYGFASYIWEHHSLFAGETSWYSAIKYPFGLHLDIATLSWFLGIDPIKLIYPFLSAITALSAAAIYGIAVESGYIDKTFSMLSGFLVLTSIYTYVSLVFIGWWAMQYTIFLIVMFVWFLTDYIKRPSYPSLAFLILLQTTIIFSYTILAPAPFFVFLLVLLFESKESGNLKIAHLIMFSFIVSLLSLNYILDLVTKLSVVPSFSATLSGIAGGGGTIRTFDLTKTGYAMWDVANLAGTSFFLLSLPGLVLSVLERKNRLALYFFVATAMLAAMWYIPPALSLTEDYYYFKTYHLLMHPAAIFIVFGLQKLLSRLNGLPEFYKRNMRVLNVVFVIFLIVSSFVVSEAAYYSIQKGGDELLVMTPDEFDVATWTKYNMPPGELAYVADCPTVMWFRVVSDHPLDLSIPKEGKYQGSDFDKWYIQAKSGDVIIVLDINQVDLDVKNFDVLYKKGDAYVLKK